MAVVPDVSVRICSQEIIKKDLQLKALIQVNIKVLPQVIMLPKMVTIRDRTNRA